MEHFFHIEGITGALAIIGVAWAVVRFIYTATKTQETMVVLVRHMYQNHLPHIESAVKKICVKMKLDYEDAPPPPVL